MKKGVINLFVFVFFSIACQAQFSYKIRADSLRIYNDTGHAELNIENSTKDIPGFLFNRGNGRTMFKKVLTKINDSVFLIGIDTLYLKQAATSLIGDITGSGNAIVNTTLANTGVLPGVYTNANLTVDSKGRIVEAANGSNGITLTTTGTGGAATLSNNILNVPQYLSSNGTTNYIPYFTSQSTLASTNLQYNGNQYGFGSVPNTSYKISTSTPLTSTMSYVNSSFGSQELKNNPIGNYTCASLNTISLIGTSDNTSQWQFVAAQRSSLSLNESVNYNPGNNSRISVSSSELDVSLASDLSVNYPISSYRSDIAFPGNNNNFNFKEYNHFDAGYIFGINGKLTFTGDFIGYRFRNPYAYMHGAFNVSGQIYGLYMEQCGGNGLRNYIGGDLKLNYPSYNNSTYPLDVNGSARMTGTITASQFILSAMNVAPSSSSDTGTAGEIRIVNGFIYVCVSTNSWQRAAMSNF